MAAIITFVYTILGSNIFKCCLTHTHTHTHTNANPYTYAPRTYGLFVLTGHCMYFGEQLINDCHTVSRMWNFNTDIMLTYRRCISAVIIRYVTDLVRIPMVFLGKSACFHSVVPG